jgi:anionic cell wall polymer biosynthesis LytR-Cps2A-Psr (LCP) family protein
LRTSPVTVGHCAEIGLLGFALVTDALGGVNVCLKAAVGNLFRGMTHGWLAEA